MEQIDRPETEQRLQRRLLGYLAPAKRVRESAHLASFVVRRLTSVFDHDEARIRRFLDTPDADLKNRSPVEIARVHGFDALDRLVDQLEYAAPA